MLYRERERKILNNKLYKFIEPTSESEEIIECVYDDTTVPALTGRFNGLNRNKVINGVMEARVPGLDLIAIDNLFPEQYIKHEKDGKVFQNKTRLLTKDGVRLMTNLYFGGFLRMTKAWNGKYQSKGMSPLMKEMRKNCK